MIRFMAMVGGGILTMKAAAVLSVYLAHPLSLAWLVVCTVPGIALGSWSCRETHQ